MTASVGLSMLTHLFRQWSAAAHGTAVTCQRAGDDFGVLLATARAQVYALAARLANDLSTAELVTECARAELTHHVPISPDAVELRHEDTACLEHARAIAWGLCARTADPDHERIERSWRVRQGDHGERHTIDRVDGHAVGHTVLDCVPGDTACSAGDG